MITTTYMPGGDVKIEPSGYPGAVCREATQPYEAIKAGIRRSKDVEPQVEAVQSQAQQQRVGG